MGLPREVASTRYGPGRPGVKVILDNDFLRVEEHPEREVLVVRRKPEQSGQRMAAGSLASAYRDAMTLLRPEHRHWGLVLDTRAVPGRNDDDFEANIGTLFPVARQAFARVVMLVGSVVGQLQIERTQGGSVQCARDEEEALRMAGRA